MTKWILGAVVLLGVCGCQDSATFSEHKQDAQQRWSDARANVMLRVARNRLASGNLDDAQKASEQAMELAPGSADAKILLGRVLIEKGKYTEAADLLDEVCRDRSQDPQAAYYLGVAQEKAGRLNDALANYQRSFALDQTQIAPIKASAEVLVALGRPREGLIQIESYLPKASDDPGMYELAGRLSLMCDQPAKAADYLQRLRDMDYKNNHYAELLARAQHAAGRNAQLVENVTELLGREDYQAPGWVYMMLGDAQLALGESQEAFNAYFSASEREPKRMEVWLSLSRAALAMNDTQRAIGSAQRALGLAPGDVNAELLLGMSLLRDGQPARAAMELKQAVKDHPDNSTLQCLLGRAHAALGRTDEAVKCYTAALRIDPQSEVAKELLQSSTTGPGVSRAQ